MFKAVIFDFDGVIYNSEPIHLAACNNVLKPYGIFVDEKIYLDKYLGKSDSEMFPLVFRDMQPSISYDIDSILKKQSRRIPQTN